MSVKNNNMKKIKKAIFYCINFFVSRSKTAYTEIKSGEIFICDRRMYVIKTMESASNHCNLENGQSIFILEPMD